MPQKSVVLCADPLRFFSCCFFGCCHATHTAPTKVGGDVGHCVSSGPEAQPVQSAMVLSLFSLAAPV